MPVSKILPESKIDGRQGATGMPFYAAITEKPPDKEDCIVTFGST
jgi:hypothetical protein